MLLLIGLNQNVFAQESLKVMTYNIRYDNPQDGENVWPKRKEKVVRLVLSQEADILGFQEALETQVLFLDENLSKYGRIGVGRDDGMTKGEFSPLFYLQDRFQLHDNGTFWLSETPERVGTKGWDANIPRIVTWAELIDKQTNSSIWVFNTHFDHKGVEARKESAALIIEKAKEMAGSSSIILMGDFNFIPESEPYRIINERFLDSFSCRNNGPTTTGVGFQVEGKQGARIDHIFHCESFECTNYRILDDNDGIYYPSDHLPVVAILSLIKRP